MDVDAIPKAIEEAKIRVKSEVMDPLMEWMEAYKVLSVSARCLYAWLAFFMEYSQVAS